jgi:hypothetical protein
MTDTPVDKAVAVAGAGPEDLDPATTGGGNPAPAEPINKAPVVEPTPEEKEAAEAEEAAKAAADKEAADKAAAEAETADDTPLDTDVWGSTGDEVGDSVMELLQNGGLSVEDAKALMYDAIQAGDATKIDKDALIEKVGKARATLILAGTRDFIATSKARNETILKDVYDTAGGKENWDSITGWAKTNVAEAELAQYRTMIDAGGAQARFATQELAGLYNADAANTTLDANTGEILGDAKPAPTGRTLTKLEYVDELGKAYDRGASETVINEIKAARARGRNAGV